MSVYVGKINWTTKDGKYICKMDRTTKDLVVIFKIHLKMLKLPWLSVSMEEISVSRWLNWYSYEGCRYRRPILYGIWSLITTKLN